MSILNERKRLDFETKRDQKEREESLFKKRTPILLAFQPRFLSVIKVEFCEPSKVS